MLRITQVKVVDAAKTTLASMRPQRNAADNVADLVLAIAGTVDASMRPQRNAADNARAQGALLAHHHASMRPQRNAADNDQGLGRRRRKCGGFNEAAAECCG